MFPINNIQELIFAVLVFLIPSILSFVFFYVCLKLYNDNAPKEAPYLDIEIDKEKDSIISPQFKFKVLFSFLWFVGTFVFFLHWYLILPTDYSDLTEVTFYRFQLLLCFIVLFLFCFYFKDSVSRTRTIEWQDYLAPKIENAIKENDEILTKKLIYEAICKTLSQTYDYHLVSGFEWERIALSMGKISKCEDLDRLYLSFLEGWNEEPRFSKKDRHDYKLIDENLDRLRKAEEKVIDKSLELILENRIKGRESLKRASDSIGVFRRTD